MTGREASTPELVDVAAVDQLTEGRPFIAAAAGREIALVRVRGEVFAIRNVCPHQTQSYLGGRAHSRIEGGDRVGELEVLEDDPVLACPWHGWEFRLRGGECLADPALRVRTYPVEVREGRVYVGLGRGRTAGD